MRGFPDLSRRRRARELEQLAETGVDVVVIGGGITGCGVALDAVTRGLSVALLERHDLAHGTSRWSSKLVHGGLRYLAQAQFGVAAESARERHHLMTSIAPHLTRPLATVIPFTDGLSRGKRATLRAGYRLGDGLRRGAGTPASLLGRSRRAGVDEAMRRVPVLARPGLDGALIGWDGQLEDDARLVVAVARTAAQHGASVITRCGVTGVEPGRVHASDELTGERLTIAARHVIAATGVWAGELSDGVQVAPSKGSHIIVPAQRMGRPTGSLTVPAHGGGAQYVFAMPTAEDTVMIGLTDIDHDGPIPETPVVEEWERDLLLETVSAVLTEPLTRADVIGSFAGLRPLLRPQGGDGATSDVSRRHAVIEDGERGLLTIVGGKLTTYRQMAQDAVDRISDRPCVTRTLPLVGAGGAGRATTSGATSPRLVRRFGSEASRVTALADGNATLLDPIAEGSDICAAELRFAAVGELALVPDDLLDRRTRAGLTPALRRSLEPAAADALAWAAADETIDPKELHDEPT